MTTTSAPDVYCVMGHPVEHSRSPWIHARFAELTGQRIDYTRRLVPLDGFAQALADFSAAGGAGCNVTVPFKHDAARLATHASDRVRRAGAANTLSFRADGTVHAENTDGLGLVADIVGNAGVALAGRDVLLVGAGGAAAGVLAPLLEQAPRRITVVNRTEARAQALVQAHADLAASRQVVLEALPIGQPGAGFDVVINATASSLAGGEVPVPATVLREGTLAYDMMYGPAAKGFMDWARAHGAVPRDGLGMLVEQAAEAFAVWRGVRPPAAQVLQELRAQL
ncbi:shikimate dehydrogenase [Paracidovorax avenae]|uniref:Shikimate dehydrogenase (NADP(+)) n=1 Tax=Paracidovorax avenae (strain ATCC 19860 / DSM 7227 / CCUG 15838 / JCM 20985 / LMG 2117 / NCPPB 1011) TaxID=643561 RepID=F0Q8M8_PARA1|nr:shikimate dehydrogenase [Paracidovorax avenae]ADX44696.1 shikimate 5-dehydrogenase [Paracidovorax avenae ATCC 19860]AVS64682.1 shikimate dehydrogenase [Paracidovorax avenae]AVS80212.1 shikimate dehydrogenase [Paracidovorax avenae]AVS92226.1 shikimate dehydrogenase [Paracidovorax avenae]AVS97975.1 shikimate dehydrogenase [Paracidovorax avenae]